MGKTPDNPSETLSEDLDRQMSVGESSDSRVSRRTIAELRAAKSRAAPRTTDKPDDDRADADAPVTTDPSPDQAPADPEARGGPVARTGGTVTPLSKTGGRPVPANTAFGRDVPARTAPAPTPAVARRTSDRRFDAAFEPLQLPARRARLSIWFWLSLLFMVVLPTALGGVYYFFIAADQYVSEFRFAVKSSNASAGSASTNVIGAALGQSSQMSAFSDNFIVADYIGSRAAVTDLLKTIDLRKIYSDPKADYLARLDPTVPTEALVKYWQSRIDASFDVSTGISVVQVRAFSAADALRIAQGLIGASEALVNRMAERAREDSVSFAERDVKNAEDRLRDITARLRQFRNVQQSPDLSTSASSTLALTLQLRTNLAQMEAQLTSLSTHMSPDAPTIKVLKNNIAATRDQLSKIEGELGSGVTGAPATATPPAADAPATPGDATAGVAPGTTAPAIGPGGQGYATTLSDYEDIRLEMQFAQQSYQNMLTALDQVRSSAMSDRTYLMPYVEPSLAEYPLYPERGEDVLIVFLLAGLAWAVTMLTVYAVRDHMI